MLLIILIDISMGYINLRNTCKPLILIEIQEKMTFLRKNLRGCLIIKIKSHFASS